MPIVEAVAALVEKAGTAAIEGVKKSAEEIKKASETGISEVVKRQVENTRSSGEIVLSKLDEIKNLTPEQLREKINEIADKYNSEETSESREADEKHKGLTEEEKAKIKDESGWSDEIIDALGSMEEYEIYKKAGLVEAEINGKKCLIRSDIDWDQKDAFGKTNRERVQEGKSPLNKNGEIIELHHIGQHSDSPLAELTTQEHRGKGNASILHNFNKESEIDREAFNKERRDHWQDRANERSN